jgi:hypothetical protein
MIVKQKINMIQEIANTIEKLLTRARAPLTTMPAVLLACSAIQMPGVSSKVIASNIIRRQGEAGAPIGAASDGSQNISEAMEVIRVEEIVKGLKKMARIDSSVCVGEIQVAGTVQTAAGPGTFLGTNVNCFNIFGIFR